MIEASPFWSIPHTILRNRPSEPAFRIAATADTPRETVAVVSADCSVTLLRDRELEVPRLELGCVPASQKRLHLCGSRSST